MGAVGACVTEGPGPETFVAVSSPWKEQPVRPAASVREARRAIDLFMVFSGGLADAPVASGSIRCGPDRYRGVVRAVSPR